MEYILFINNIIVPLVKKFEMGTGKPDKILCFDPIWTVFPFKEAVMCSQPCRNLSENQLLLKKVSSLGVRYHFVQTACKAIRHDS